MKVLTLSRGLQALVDPDVYEWASRQRWHAGSGTGGKWYACRTVRKEDGRTTTVYLHRMIAGGPGLEVDHLNGDTLDNRRVNLAQVTHQQNLRNRRCGYGRTGERNVYRTRHGRFEVKLSPKSGAVRVGVFDTLPQAVEAARTARLRYFGKA